METPSMTTKSRSVLRLIDKLGTPAADPHTPRLFVQAYEDGCDQDVDQFGSCEKKDDLEDDSDGEENALPILRHPRRRRQVIMSDTEESPLQKQAGKHGVSPGAAASPNAVPMAGTLQDGAAGGAHSDPPPPCWKPQSTERDMGFTRYILPLAGDPMGGGSTAEQARAVRTDGEAAEELERVLKRFEVDSGLPRERLVRVERVQNLRLWDCYSKRKFGAQERYLWCGLSTLDVGEVILKGFSALNSAGTDTSGEETLFMANSSMALDKALECEREMARVLRSAAGPTPARPRVVVAADPVPSPVPSPVHLAESVNSAPSPGGQVAATAFAAIAEGFRQGLSGALLRVWSKLPWPIGPGRAKHNQEDVYGTDDTDDEPFTSAAATASAQVPRRTVSPDFPGKGGALLLCRVVLGEMAVGGTGGGDADSVLHTAALTASMQRRNAAATGRAARAAIGALDDPVWNVNGLYAEDLAVSLRCVAEQAYPEYIVHFD